MSIQTMEAKLAESGNTINQLEAFLAERRGFDVSATVKAARILLEPAKILFDKAVESLVNAECLPSYSTEETAETVLDILLPEIADMVEKIGARLSDHDCLI